jgi:hypothetical protein
MDVPSEYQLTTYRVDRIGEEKEKIYSDQVPLRKEGRR